MQEVESAAQQNTTIMSMAGAGVPLPADGGAQLADNLAASVVPACPAQQIALEPPRHVSSKVASKQVCPILSLTDVLLAAAVLLDGSQALVVAATFRQAQLAYRKSLAMVPAVAPISCVG